MKLRTDYSLLRFIGRFEGEAGGTAPFLHLSAELCHNACYATLMTERDSAKIEAIFLLCDKAPRKPEDNLGKYRICGTITNYR